LRETKQSGSDRTDSLFERGTDQAVLQMYDRKIDRRSITGLRSGVGTGNGRQL